MITNAASKIYDLITSNSTNIELAKELFNNIGYDCIFKPSTIKEFNILNHILSTCINGVIGGSLHYINYVNVVLLGMDDNYKSAHYNSGLISYDQAADIDIIFENETTRENFQTLVNAWKLANNDIDYVSISEWTGSQYIDYPDKTNPCINGIKLDLHINRYSSTESLLSYSIIFSANTNSNKFERIKSMLNKTNKTFYIRIQDILSTFWNTYLHKQCDKDLLIVKKLTEKLCKSNNQVDSDIINIFNFIDMCKEHGLSYNKLDKCVSTLHILNTKLTLHKII